MIEGVKLIDLKQNFDDRGQLYEVCHNYDLPKFGQIYVVSNWQKNTIRAFHKHKILWDYFHIINGSAKFILADIIDFPETNFDTFVLTSKKPQLLVIPPNVYHGWISLEENTILVAIGSETYNKENPDEERVSFNYFEEYFGDLWKVQFK